MGVEFRWQSDGAPIAETACEPPWRSRPVRRRLLAVALVVLAAVGAIHWRAQRGLAAARADLERVVAGEVLALQTGRKDLFLAALDSSYASWTRYHEESWAREAAWYAARPAARPRIAGLRLSPDRAEATVVLSDGAREWRGTWYFVRVDGRWRHAPPPPEFWGESAEFDAGHLTLTAQGPDREPAALLAPELEALYSDLVAIYPAAPAPRDEFSGYDVGHARARAPRRIALRSFPYGGSGSSADYFPSPQLALEMWTPRERAAELGRSARLALARAVLLQALGRSRPDCGDWWLVEALSLWHARAWRPDWRPFVQEAIAAGTFASLLDVRAYGAEPTLSWPEGCTPLPQSAVQPLAYTMGEHLASACTPQQLGALVAAIRDGSSGWEALQAVLGVSRSSLEAAWGAFLQSRYGG